MWLPCLPWKVVGSVVDIVFCSSKKYVFFLDVFLLLYECQIGLAIHVWDCSGYVRDETRLWMTKLSVNLGHRMHFAPIGTPLGQGLTFWDGSGHSGTVGNYAVPKTESNIIEKSLPLWKGWRVLHPQEAGNQWDTHVNDNVKAILYICSCMLIIVKLTKGTYMYQLTGFFTMVGRGGRAGGVGGAIYQWGSSTPSTSHRHYFVYTEQPNSII